MRFYPLLSICILLCSLATCQDPDMPSEEELVDVDMESINTDQEQQAVITDVEVGGSENNYTFKVTIKSPDTGCKQYADWWEVFDQEGNLLYRRILNHSHVDEQPFTRSGGPIKIDKGTFVYIRGHMSNLGYGSFTFSGTAEGGFSQETIGLDFYPELEETTPLPKNCDF